MSRAPAAGRSEGAPASELDAYLATRSFARVGPARIQGSRSDSCRRCAAGDEAG